MAYGIDAHRLWLPPRFDEPNRLFDNAIESDLKEARHEKETDLAQESPDDFRVNSASGALYPPLRRLRRQKN